MLNVLIVGCGFVGEATADLFHRAGWRVTGWTHSPESAARLCAAKPYPVAACDITERGEVANAAKSLPAGTPDVVIDCVSSGRGGGPEQYRRVYLEGARNLSAVFDRARLVYTGSTSVYAQTDGSEVDEASPAVPDRETGRILLETEAVVLAAPGGGVVARLAGIYGPGRSILLKKFLAGEAVIEGDGQRWLNQIHRDDAAAALWRLAQSNAPARVYNVADGTPLTQIGLYRGLADLFHRGLPPHGPEDRQRKRGWTSKRVDSQRLRGLGWEPQWPSFLHWAAEQAGDRASGPETDEG